MAKQVYKIPIDLDQSFGNMEIAIQSNGGLGVKPLPVKVILAYVVSAIMLFYLCSQTALSMSPYYWVPFSLCWIIATILLARYDRTKRLQAQMIPSLFGYISKTARNIIVRRDCKANGFISICGIKDIDKETGLVSYEDGTYAFFYRVVGSASILLFDEDRDAIISRVDSFYRKLGTECEIGFVTSKEAQKVYRQIANLKRCYDNLDCDDEDLKMLAEEQFYVLKNDIGGSFRSIHQYMFIKADNKEMLVKNKNVVQSEVENSSLMFKQCIALGAKDVYNVLKTIYAS